MGNVESYFLLIQEDSVLEYGSALLWGLSAVILLIGMLQQAFTRQKDYGTIRFDLILFFFFLACAGEELSWGQRLIHIETPGLLKAINVQNEITLHNVGSISIFSNIFFILTLCFFIILPYISFRYRSISVYLIHKSFPIPNRFAVAVFLTTLFIWMFIGIRFGTLGFHPFSLYVEQYYNQMDDEIFEFLAAYSFLTFSILNGLTPKT